MKKLTVLLTVLIVLSNISICSFAFETTDDERSVHAFASEFLNKYYSNVYRKTEYDLSKSTIASFDDTPQIKNEIFEKAKEYEDEIRDNHHYRYHEDNIFLWEAEECDENGACLPPDPDPDTRPVAIQYDSTAIEDVISSFPVFIEKKASYWKSVKQYIPKSNVSYILSPQRVTVSEIGFAYIDSGDLYILLYRYRAPDENMWIVCDVSTFYDEYDEKYRFHSEDMDVEKELLSKGFVPLSENKDDVADTDTDSSDENVNIAHDAPKKSNPTNIIPWVICGIEAVAIIALVIALVLKKSNKIRAAENKNILSE